jgi:8-oxo-dGTP diphosphatase
MTELEVARSEAKPTTLCFVFNEKRQLLMIQKKRGLGEGRFNTPGGKVEPGESSREAAMRETFEETGILPLEARQVGTLEFYFADSQRSWNNICSVFVTDRYTGILNPESQECSAAWVDIDQIPYAKMWPDDILWVPLLLRGEKFHRVYRFNEQHEIIDEEVLT